MKIELLNPKVHNRTQFDCGVNALNAYLQCVANQDQKRNLTRVYVLTEKTDILGFYSISSHSVSMDELPDNLRLGSYRSVPFLLLGRLAIDNRFKGQSHGAKLLYHAFKMTSELAERIGISGMIVDAKDEQAVSFYQKFGFKRLSASPYRLVLTLSTMKTLLD
jgi:ribosomal protein S18 acetylase RimI-like enzyme